MSKAEQFAIFIVLFIGAVSIAVLNDYFVRRSARKKKQPFDDSLAPAAPTPAASKTDWKMVVALIVVGPLLVYLSLFTTWFQRMLGGLHKGFVALVIGIIVLSVGLIALSFGRQYWRLRHLRRAVKLVREGNPARAIGMLQEEIQCRGPSFDLLNAVVVIYVELKEWDNALRACAELEVFSPNHFINHANRGVALRERGELPEALESFRQAHSLAPLDMNIAFNYGSVLVQMGELTEAKTVLARLKEALGKHIFLFGGRQAARERFLDRLQLLITAASRTSNKSTDQDVAANLLTELPRRP